MPDMYFKIAADYQELERMRNEVIRLESKLKSFTPGTSKEVFNYYQKQLTDTRIKMDQLSKAAAQAGAEINFSITKGVNGAASAIQRLQGLLRNPLGGAATVAGIAGIGEFLHQITAVRGQFQQMETNINTILQSETKGRKLMTQLTDFAKVSPLDFKGVVGSAQQMLGFGLDAEKIPRFLSAIGDVSMGDRQKFSSLTLAFSQMSAAGKLMGQDLLQMVNAGFQPLNVMAEKTGKSIGQLKEEMSQGKITAEMVQQAFIDATSAGGKYFQMSEKASQTIPGQMSMLEDAFDLLFNDLGKKAEGTVISVIEGATAIVENVDKIAPILGKVVAAYGIYKAAAMASIFAEKKAQKDKADAIRSGFEEELAKMDELKRKRIELSSGTTAQTPDFVKGARYDKTKSRELVDKIFPNGVQIPVELQAKEGSDALKKAQLSAFENAFEGMTPDEKTSDFGKALHEQIEGLKADLNDLVLLDSDLREAVSLGYLDASVADTVQRSRNELEDSIQPMEEYAQNARSMADAAQTHADSLTAEVDQLAEKVIQLHEAGDEQGEALALQEFAVRSEEEANAVREAHRLATEADEAEERLHTAQLQLDTVAQRANTASTAGNTAATGANTAGKSKNAVVTALMAAGNKAASITNHLLSSAVNTCRRAVEGLNAAWRANPIGLIASGIMAVWAAVSAFKDDSEELTESQKKYGEETVKTSNHVQSLYAVLEVSDKQSRTYKDALDELKKTATEYGLQIKDESDIYDQLIEKKERLIELILEEGRQRVIASKVEKYQNNIMKAENDFQKSAAKMFNVATGGKYEDYADAFAMLISQDAIKNAARVNELSEKLKANQAFASAGNIIEDSNIREELNNLVFGSSREYAQRLGIDFQQIGNMWGPLKDLTDGFLSNSRAMNIYTTAVRQSREEMEKLKDKKPDKDYLKLDASAIAKDAKTTLQELGKLRNQQVEIKVDGTQVKSAAKSAKDASESIDNLDGKTASPAVDSSETEKLKDKAGEAEDKLSHLEDKTIKPSVDTEGIDTVIKRLNTAIALTYQLNGETKNGYLTESERNQLEEVKARLVFYTNKNGVKMAKGKKEDIRLYNRLNQAAKENSKVSIDGKEYELNEDEAAKWRAFRERDGLSKDNDGKYNVNTSGNEEVAEWAKGIKATKDKESLDKQVKDAQAKWESQKEGFRKKIQEAHTNDEYNAVKKELNGLMGSVAPKSAEEKWLKSMIETIDIKTGKKKNTYDPKDAQWKRDEAERKFYEELKKSAAKREQELEDERIDAMVEGTDKSIAQARNEAKKKRDALLQSEDETARQLMEKDREIWVERNTKKDKDGKVVKQAYAYQFEALQKKAADPDTYTEYKSKLKDGESAMSEEDYYASIGHLPKTDAFYRKRAEEKLGHAQKMMNIGNNETRGLEEIYKKQEDDLRDFLSSFGSLEQQREAKRAGFLKRIEDGKKSGNAADMLKATAELKNLEDEINSDKLFKDLNWEQVFSDFDRYSIDALNGLRDKLNEVLNDNSLEIDFEDKQKLLDGIDEIGRAIESRTKEIKERNGWSELLGSSEIGSVIKARRDESQRKESLKRDADAASARHESAKKDEEHAKSSLDDKRQSALDYIRKQTGNNDLNAEQLTSANSANILKMFQDKGLNTSELSAKMGDILDAEKDLFKAEEITQKTGADAEAAKLAADGGMAVGPSPLAATGAIIQGVNANIQSFGDVLEDLGLEDTGFAKGFADFAESSQYATEAFNSLKQGNIMGVVHNLNQAVGSLGKVFGRMGIAGMGESDVSLHDDFERLTRINQELTVAIRKLSEDIRESNVSETEGLSRQAEADIRQSMAHTAELIQRYAAVYNSGFLGIGGKHSSNVAVNNALSHADWRKVSEAAGVTVSGASDFFKLTSEQMANVQKKAPEIFSMIRNAASEGYGDAAQFMDQYIQYWEQLEDLMEATMDKLTSMSFDELSSSFRSSLDKMRKDGSAFKEDFADMMRNVIEDDIFSKYEEQLKAWREKFSEFRKEDSQGGLGLTTEERDRLYEEWRLINQAAEAEYSAMYDMMGLDSLYEQSARAKTYEGMTQDQAMELNGRLTAIAATTELIRQKGCDDGVLLSRIDGNVFRLTENTVALLPAVYSVEDILARTAVDISLIQDNTAAVVKPIIAMGENLREIKESIKNI